MPFFIVPLSIGLSLLHLYVWKRLVKDTMSPGPKRRVATGVLVGLDLFLLAALLLGMQVPQHIARWFAWPGMVWFGLFFYLMVTLLVLEIVRLALLPWLHRDPSYLSRRARKAAKHDSADEVPPEPEPNAEPQRVSRRVLLARGSAAVAGITATALVGYGLPVALSLPEVKRVRIGLRRLDPLAAGCRIALVSDIHLGPLLGRSFTQRVVDLVNAQQPDLVAIAGDLVDGSVAHLAEAAEPLRDLRSTHGTYFVTGNHEFYSGYSEWVDHVRTLGVRPLLNERTTITHNGGSFELAGIIDPNAEMEGDPSPDLPKTLRGWDRQRALVLLAHQPRPIDEAAEQGVDLQLSGHTHGGQIAPFNFLVKALEGTTGGLSRVGQTQLYVTRGAGFWGPPVRVGAPPDIAVIELQPA